MTEAYVGKTAEATAIENATALGGVRVLVQLIEQIEEAGRESDEDIELVKGVN